MTQTATLSNLPGVILIMGEWAAEQAVELGAREAYDRALSMSSGPASYAEMRDADYPYAKRHGRALWPPEIINEHTGAFKRAWHVRDVDRFEKHVINDSRVADWLQHGTRYMVNRPIAEAVEFITEFDLARRTSFPSAF